MRSDLALLALLALVRSTPAFAADAPVVEARVKFISTTRPLVGIGLAHGKKTEAIVIPTDMFSEEVVYRGPARLELVELNAVAKPTETKPPADEKAAAKPPRGVKAREPAHEFVAAGKPPIAWIDLPKSVGPSHLILLVTPGRDNGIVAINDPPGSFPPGSNRYFNLCGFPVVAKLPSFEKTLPPGDSTVLRPGAKNNDYYGLQFLAREDAGERTLFSTRIYHMETVRKLYLIIPVPGADGRVDVREIEDRPPSAKGQTLTPTAPKGAR